MAELLIFNDRDELLCVASSETGESLHFWDAPFTESLSDISTLKFTCEPDHKDTQFIENKNQVAFMDKDDIFRLTTITHVENEVQGVTGQIDVWCDDGIFDLASNILTDIRLRDVTPAFALERALSGQTRWRVGNVAPLSNNTTSFFYISSLEAIKKIQEVWDVDLRARVEVSGNRIVGRFVDLVRRGTDTGLTMEVGRNISDLRLRIETAHICTLLYGRGSGIPGYNMDTGEATGGYTRRIMFTDLVATEATHGFAKPRGQPFLVDDDARELYGLVNPATGIREHLEGVHVESTEEDPDRLMRRTWDVLQSKNKPHYQAMSRILNLAELLGEEYAHEQVGLGDMIRLADHETFAKPILLESRIRMYSYNLVDHTDGRVELANFYALDTNSRRISNIEAELDSGSWTQPSSIGPGNIANVTPRQVKGLVARGGFSQINLTWEAQGILVRDFELHGSEVEGFTPNDFNLIYRGDANIFVHQVEPNRRWHYICRAVNQHGVPGAWSERVYAQTENTRRAEEIEEIVERLTADITGAVNDAILALQQSGALTSVVGGLASSVENLEVKSSDLLERIERLETEGDLAEIIKRLEALEKAGEVRWEILR